MAKLDLQCDRCDGTSLVATPRKNDRLLYMHSEPGLQVASNTFTSGEMTGVWLEKSNKFFSFPPPHLVALDTKSI